MKELGQDIKIVQLIPIATITETAEGSAIDTKITDMFNLDSALINIEIGDLGDQTSTKVKIEEDDASDFSGATVADGGAEITVAADTSYKMEVKRTKRYIRAVITIAGGSSPSAEVFVGGIQWNVPKPFPTL